uniref:Tubulin_C domain-containing protein n=1 Tax=Angiostrongylus cantonensis TaxID=6313 RepID=A0A158P810_ANGCA
MVADCSETYGTKMNTDAIAISVAPSLFHSCIHDGRQVKVEDVQRFKLASEVVKNIIASFGHINLFPRECYEFYARITGRTLRVDENWLFSFQYPSSEFFRASCFVSLSADNLLCGVTSSAAFSAMAARCAGAYSLAALHLEVSAFEPSEVNVRRVNVDDAVVVHGMHRTFSLNRHPLAHTTDHPKRPNLGSTIGVGVNEFVDLKQSVSCDF